jgi:hypothetical protein
MTKFVQHELGYNFLLVGADIAAKNIFLVFRGLTGVLCFCFVTHFIALSSPTRYY